MPAATGIYSFSKPYKLDEIYKAVLGELANTLKVFKIKKYFTIFFRHV